MLVHLHCTSLDRILEAIKATGAEAVHPGWSRFHELNYTETQRKDRDITSLMHANESLTDSEKKKFESFKMKYKMFPDFYWVSVV